jgi:hypothetical protein
MADRPSNTPPPFQPSRPVVVLYTQSADPYGDYFADGLNDELTPDYLDLDAFKRSLGSAPAEEFNAEGALRWAVKWHEAEARWKALLGLEASLDVLRICLERLYDELEASLKTTLTPEEKLHAVAADVSEWTKAKSRVHDSLPKAKDFIYRARCANRTPERTKLEEFFRSAFGAPVLAPELEQVLEVLRKSLDALYAQGAAISFECKSVSADVQRAFWRLQAKKWQEPESQWKTILGLEGNIDDLRGAIERLCAELEASLKRALTTEEKLHALAADVSEWTQARGRIQFGLPRAKDFVHRAKWAKGTPERRLLANFFKSAPGVSTAGPQINQALEVLRKNLQILYAQGVAISYECKSVSANVQGALGRLQSNSTARRAQKMLANRAKRKWI